MEAARKIRVLVVDDSAVVRRALSAMIEAQPDLEVAGTACDAFVARDKILALDPDVITLDLEMPRMDGLTFLKKLMRFHPLPVIVVSSLGRSSSRAAIEALESGAVDVVPKPGGAYSAAGIGNQLASKIRAASRARAKPARAPEAPAERSPAHRGTIRILALGASTGGVEAIGSILPKLPGETPPIVIVQHIPPVFSSEFAARLGRMCRIRVKEARDGDLIEPGLALIAPGNFHMSVRKTSDGLRADVHSGEPVHFQRPAVDVLFHSVAREVGTESLGILLTGMGVDGAAGLLAMKQAGARTIAQDEATSVVFGMPREAIRLGAASEILPLQNIAGAIARLSQQSRAGG